MVSLRIVALALLTTTTLYAQTPAELLRQTVENKMRITPEEAKRQYEKAQISLREGTQPHTIQAGENETVVSNDSDVESEVHAAINPTDTSNIIVSPIKQATGVLTCPIYYTKDFGKTWKKSNFTTAPHIANTTVLGGGDPIIAFDANGKAYMSWIHLYALGGNFNNLYVGMYWASSTDGGETWIREENDIIGHAKTTQEFFDKQWMVVDRTNSPYRGTLYTALYHPVSNKQEIAIAIKPANSSAFNPQLVPVSSSDFTLVQFAEADIDEQGNVHVTFFGSKNSRDYALWHSVSTNGGATFSTPVKVADAHVPRFSSDESNPNVVGISSQRFYPCPQFVIDKSNTASRGNLYLAWTANGMTTRGTNGLDIYFTRSTNNGKTWSSPTIINDDPEGSGLHQFYPSMAVNDNGVLTVTWYDRRNDPNNAQTHYYMAHSFNGGLSFTPNTQVSTVPSNFYTIGQKNNGFGIGEYTQVVTTNHYAIPVWADGRTNNGQLDIYAAFMPIQAGGVTTVERIASVSEHIALYELLPNPAQYMATVHFNTDQPMSLQLHVTDIRGEEVLPTVHTTVEAGEHALKLDISPLVNGSYYVHMTTPFGRLLKTLKVVR